jgi:histidinol-phosphate/aromatic aminotransferase/cobyric acid decarboxylase-like protein
MTGPRPSARPGLSDLRGLLPAGEHGGDGARLARLLGVPPDQILDLSASLNPLAPPVAPVVARHLEALDRYPDAGPATDTVADLMGVPRERLLLTNGGAEAIALVAAELGAGWVQDPDFSLYRRHLPRLTPAAGRWRSNPRSPTGELAGPEETAAVWDEAFWPLATGTWTRGDADRGAVVLGSLTKLLACPGLRIGYVLCPEADLARRLAARQPRWSVNGLVCEALPELLGGVDLAGWAAGIARLRHELVGVLEAAGFTVRPSTANWVLVDAPYLRRALAPEGILVRDCASFGLPGVVRVAVPNGHGLARLAAALERVAGAARG